jgi:phosphatidylinositol alpha-1,6-mannosyltransferase
MPPVIQIPPGVDVERFFPISSSRRREVRENFGFAESDLVVASYSRLVPRKGMDTLIRAAAQLRGSLPELVVAIGGSGRDRERLEKLAHHENAPVRFLGRVSDDDLPGWIAASDLMVMDCRSRWLGLEQEGFGIVFAEAAACGVAQIAGRSGGSHDAVEHGVTGMVVDDPSSSGDLATAIAKLLGDADLRGQLGSNARRHAESTFSWTLLAERLGRELETFDRYRRGDEG